jgi:cobaltochelatase CobS
MSTESKLNGFVDANGHTVESGYRRAWLGGWIYGADELDNSNPAIVTGLNSGLANGVHSFPDGTFRAGEGFTVIATANTFGTGPTAEFAGRQKLDPATLNRFAKIFIDTDEAMEDHIVGSMIGEKLAGEWLRKVRHVRRAVADLRIKQFVTMRDSINGAKLIAPGDGAFTQLEALEHTMMAVLTEDQVDKVKAWRG